MKSYEIYIFIKSAFIPKDFEINENIKIKKLDPLILIGEINVIKNFSSTKSGFTPLPIDVLERMVDDPKYKSDVLVIELKNIIADDKKSAYEQVIHDVNLIIDIISTYQKNKGGIFSYIIRENFEPYGIYCNLIPPSYRKITNLSFIDERKIFSEQLFAAKSNERYRLFLRLYSDATKELNPYYHLVKIWSLLETLAEYVENDTKENKVRKLFGDHDLTIEELPNDMDLIKLMYKCRNSIVHEGDVGLMKFRKKNPEIGFSDLDFDKCVEQLDDNTRFLIRKYKFYDDYI